VDLIELPILFVPATNVIILKAINFGLIGIYSKTFSQQTDCLKLLTGKMEDDSTMLQALNEVSGAIIGYLAIIIPLLALL
jgi:hypothetical protein